MKQMPMLCKQRAKAEKEGDKKIGRRERRRKGEEEEAEEEETSTFPSLPAPKFKKRRVSGQRSPEHAVKVSGLTTSRWHASVERVTDPSEELDVELSGVAS